MCLFDVFSARLICQLLYVGWGEFFYGLVSVVGLVLGGLPVFASFLAHSLVGDYITGPTQLFWPLPSWYVASNPLRLSGVVESLVEVILFVLMLVVLSRRGGGFGFR
jgi:hypothetical protein